MQDELKVKTNIGFEGAALKKGLVGIALVDITKAAKKSVGNQLDVPAGRNVLQSGRGCGLVKSSLNANGDSRPEQVFIGARDGAV